MIHLIGKTNIMGYLENISFTVNWKGTKAKLLQNISEVC